ncbi:unnamed protein product, partial [Tenebrio molitor]
MLKILILFALVAAVFGKPGLNHGIAAPVVTAPVGIATPHVISPTAVSQQSRHDIINPGVITYTTAHAAPVVAAAPVVTAAVPAVRVSSALTSQLDVRRPAVAAIAAAPVAVGTVGHGAGLANGFGLVGIGGFGDIGLGGHGGMSHRPKIAFNHHYDNMIKTINKLNTTSLPKTIKMFKLVVLSALVAIVAAKPGGLLGYSAIAAPAVVAAPAVAVPAAVSHQYRTDVISKPVVATYAAAPIVQRTVVAAAPAVYAHAAPVAY